MPDKNACELLDADHIAVKHLFVAYARLAFANATDSRSERAALAREICDELTVHATIEEELFYPALRKALPAASDVLAEARTEHRQARDLIAQIRGLRHADAQMDALVADLNVAVEHHVKEERDELFPKAKTAAGLDLAALGAQLAERQQQLLAEMKKA